MALPECTDAIGNKLKKGDLVKVEPEGKLLVGEIIELSQGGLNIGGRDNIASLTIVVTILIGGPSGCAFKQLLALRTPTKKEQSSIIGST